MGKYKSIFTLLILFATSYVFGQNGNSSGIQQSNMFRIQVLSLPDSAAVPYANVVAPRTLKGATTDEKGFFYMNLLPNDEIAISALGFMSDTVSVQRYFLLKQRYFTVYLKRKQYLLNEVTITEEGMDLGIGKKNTTPMQIRSESFNDGPSVMGAVFSPLSTARYFLSKEEKQKKRAREIYSTDKKWGSFYDRVTPDRIKRQTGATDEQYERFMPYFNINNKLSPHASERDIEQSIAHLWSSWIEKEEAKAAEQEKKNKK